MFVLLIGLALAVFLFGFFLYTRFEYVACDNNVCLTGKTALVTGGSRGLGYEIVLRLAARGCRIIIASRTVTEELRNRIVEATDNPNIILEYVDFTSFKSVRLLAEKLHKTEEKLDILINNAGVGKSLRIPTEDGLNKTLQVNHYSAFLLTHLVVDLLKKSDNGRIIFTSSFLSYIHLLTRNSVTTSKIKDSTLSTFDYPHSKFCAIIMADMFAAKLKKWNITSNSYQPGITETDIFNETKKNIDTIPDAIIYYLSMHLLECLFSVSPKQTAQTAVEIATAKKYKTATGQFVGHYFHDVKPRGANDKKLCEAIWRASEVAVGLKEEEKLQ